MTEISLKGVWFVLPIHTYIHTCIHDRNLIERRMVRASQVMAVLGIAGLGCAIVQNELIIGGHDPNGATVNALKVSRHM